jgi:hypothetical protein
MIFTRVAPLVFLTILAGPPRQTPILTVSVSSDPASNSAPLRIIASAGTIVSGGRSYRSSADTLRLTGSAEVTTRDPVFVATFIADTPGARISVVVRENGNPAASGVGEAIVVIRTPLGAQLQAMAVPAELRRTP